MWLEAVLTKEDLERVLRHLTPCTIRLGEEGKLHIEETSGVSLVPGRGLRAVCRAKLHWPVLGIDVPVTLRSLIVLVSPVVEQHEAGQALVFKLQIEHVDAAMVPTLIDDRVTAKVNEQLAKKHVELAWGFAKMLSHVFSLPGALEPPTSLALGVKDGAVRVTETSLSFAVSFGLDVGGRRDETNLEGHTP
jgi:hypothetical protein